MKLNKKLVTRDNQFNGMKNMRLALSKHIFIRMEGELHFHGIIFVMKTFFSCNLFVFKHGAKSLNKRINKNYVREFFFSLFCRCKQPFKTRRNKQRNKIFAASDFSSTKTLLDS